MKCRWRGGLGGISKDLGGKASRCLGSVVLGIEFPDICEWDFRFSRHGFAGWEGKTAKAFKTYGAPCMVGIATIWTFGNGGLPLF